jgi:phosphoribosylglycinamide formyltransferase-1
VVDHKAHASREAFDAALARAIDALRARPGGAGRLHAHPGPDFVQRYEGRLLNIHPSLLPAFPGLHTHRRALEAGCKAGTGATVHFVTPELDHGPDRDAGRWCRCWPGDDEDTLAARVLATEHVIYPLAVRWFVEGKLQRRGGLVRQLDGASQCSGCDTPCTPTRCSQ